MSQGKVIDASIVFAVGAIFILSAVFTLGDSGELLFTGSEIGWICPFRLIFSYHCPFCGLSRSFIALAHGDFYISLRYHPLGWLMFLSFAASFIAICYSMIRKRPAVCESRIFIVGCLVVAAIFVLYWVIQIIF